jgi:arylsulfate sulfotransferase
MTATLLFHYFPPASLYSFFGGNVNLLENGDIEADFCAAKTGSEIQELNITGASPQLVWQARTPYTNQYRVDRLPSLYPGVQW